MINKVVMKMFFFSLHFSGWNDNDCLSEVGIPLVKIQGVSTLKSRGRTKEVI
jgi:hypothetical protein